MAEQLKKKRVREAKKPFSKTIKNNKFKSYDFDDRINLDPNIDLDKIKSVPEMVALAESGKAEIEGIVYAVKDRQAKPFKLNTKSFVEAFNQNKRKRVFREAIDTFATDMDAPAGQIGSDFTPLLGGPFNKQLYLYDYLKMHSVAFQASTHDPILKTAVQIINEFVLGRGFRVDCENKAALALWRAFEEVNDLQNYMYNFNRELTIYGEQFIHWLENGATAYAYQVSPEQMPPKGIIPRIRPIDPSTVWEVVTYPEDIKRVLYLQQVFPTQYQIYTGSDKGRQVPSTKFIYQQIPAAQFDHYKINSVSNEKRGRSDLFPVLGYAKRLRDAVNYSIIGLQKSTAWSIDTTIDGNQQDIDNYVASQEALGTIPPPGSEFVHSTKVTRQYLSNEGSSKGGNSQAFEWCFSMICAGLGIPQSYFATHLSGGNTRATAVVATEPVTKKFEMRQQLNEKVIKDMAKRLFETFGIDAEIEVTFPDLVTQDRTAKLKDLALAEQQEWLSKKTSASIAAKELGLSKYEFEEEMAQIKKEREEMAGDIELTNPLTAPPAIAPQDSQPSPVGGLTSEEQRKIKDQNS